MSELVTTLKRFARYYRAIVHPENERNHDLKSAFERFKLLGVATALPLLMDWYDRFDYDSRPDAIDKESFLSMLDALESFVIRRWIRGERTRGYGSDFAQAKESSTMGDLLRYFHRRGWPSDTAIQEALLEFPLYDKDKSRTRLILDQLEISYGHREQVDVRNRDVITIEHVMPQTERIPESWRQMLGDNSSEIHKTFCHTLGNLTLRDTTGN